MTLVRGLGLVTSDASEEQWRKAIEMMRSGTVVLESPYVGLRSYTPEESNVYVGRERAYEDLVAACRREDARVVVVVGDSGAGKSSLLAAGLMGRACAPDGPLSTYTPVSVEPADLHAFSAPDAPTLLVVDQFEEAERFASAERSALFAALDGLPSHVMCVVGLAAGSFGFAMQDERFARHLSSPVLVGPLDTLEYTRIISEPAQLHGRSVAPELVQLVLRDLHLYGEPSPGTTLPLLSSVMRRVWKQAAGDVLEASDYVAVGGLWSSLDDEAEAVFERLEPEQQVRARRLLLSLVEMDGERVSRRKIDWEAEGLDTEMAPIVQEFLSARLFKRTEEHLSISHSALLTRWNRLARWLEEEQTSLLIARRIRLAAQLWDEGGRSSEALMPAEAKIWHTFASGEDAPLLSPVEDEFIRTSLEHADSEKLAAAKRLRSLRKRQNAAILAAVVALAMFVAASIALLRIDYYRQVAEATTVEAQSKQIALIADELRPTTPNTAGQWAAAAFSMDQSVQTRSAVLKSGGAPMPTRVTGPTGNAMVGYSEEHGIILRGDSQGIITIWRDSKLLATPRSRGQRRQPALRARGGGRRRTGAGIRRRTADRGCVGCDGSAGEAGRVR